MNTMRILVLTMVLAGSTTALADSAQTPVVNAREDRQEQRIEQGVASGEITGREAARLQHGQTVVDRKQSRAEADGVVSNRERLRLQREQNQQSRRIHRQKHDRQDRG